MEHKDMTVRNSNKIKGDISDNFLGINGRKSNIELLRIISMMAIIAHHYVVNSGIMESFDYSNITANMVFLQIWGLWGKTMVNVFILISGYFMCTSYLTVRRYLKVFLEYKFYKIVLFIIMMAAGYEVLSIRNLFVAFFGIMYNANNGFTSSFLFFYMFIPFYNVVIKNTNRKQLLGLVTMLIAMFTISASFFFNKNIFNEIGWYMTLYFIAAYVRIYGAGWMRNNSICYIGLVLQIILAICSMLVIDFVGSKFGITSYTFLVADSNKILALGIGLFLFLIFRNMEIPFNKGINKIASATFGVLCIHANSDAVRQFLWKGILRVPKMYTARLPLLIIHAVLSMLIIFVICTIIDLVRMRTVEKTIFKWLTQFKWLDRRFDI